MSVRLTSDGAIALEGVCPAEDAETLLQHLLTAPAAVVDWSTCEAAHTAIVQVLMISNATVRAAPRGEFLRDRVADALQRSGDRGPSSPAA